MATYPTAPKVRASGSSRAIEVPTVKSESEGAYTRERRLTTKVKRKWKLNYNNITKDDFIILEDFFLANKGLTFQFTYPGTATEYDVGFAQDTITQAEKDGVLVSTSVELEER